MIIRCVDVETTGLDPKDGASVCELGWCDMWHAGPTQWEIGEPKAIFVNPGHKIPPAMSGIHHITDDMVEGAPSFSVAAVPLLANGHDVILCAYNNRFEMKFITTPARWVDAYRVALVLAPKAPDHKLQTLRYWLKLAGDKSLMESPHRSGPDAYITALLMQRMLQKLSVEEMLAISSRPAILQKFTFGKHAMKPIEEIDDGYLRWVLDNIADDEDVRATAAHHLQMRRK